MRIQYRHQVPGPVQYGVKEATFEDDVDPDAAEETLRRWAAWAEAAVPWPTGARRPAPADDPQQALARPSVDQINRLRHLASAKDVTRKAPRTAAEADEMIRELEAPAAPAMVPAGDVDVEAYDAKLRGWFRDVVRDLEAATGEPVQVPAPSSEAEMRELCKQLSDERKRLGADRPGTSWSGHGNPGYPRGSTMALRDRRCSYEHCDGRTAGAGRAITADEWDWSIRNHGRPLCRACQKVGPA